jgi:hypothetical protein
VPGENFVSMSYLTYFEHHRHSFASFNLELVEESSVARVILDMTSNSEGSDGISRDMVLLTLPRTLAVITAIINKSLHSGIFPCVWKEGRVNPIPKLNNPSQLKDLRPITILPFLSKIVEKLICLQLTNYLNYADVLPIKQSGFQPNHSTATAMLDVVDDILTGQDAGMGSILVFLDFSRAFDTINHDLLLSKLSYYGFDSSALKWFSSYLSDRSQRVMVTSESGNRKTSRAVFLRRGVPQGPILGPILFNLYTADLVTCIKNCKYHAYANDLQIYLSFKPQDTITSVSLINEDLNRINEWALKNCFVLNPLKSKFILLGSHGKTSKINDHNPVIKLNGTAIEQVTETRSLGILIDSRLKFHNHVVQTVKSCFYRLKVLYQVRKYLDIDTRV